MASPIISHNLRSYLFPLSVNFSGSIGGVHKNQRLYGVQRLIFSPSFTLAGRFYSSCATVKRDFSINLPAGFFFSALGTTLSRIEYDNNWTIVSVSE